MLREPPDASKQAKVFGVIAARPSHAPWQRRCPFVSGHPVAVARAGPSPGIPAGIRAVFPRQVVTEKRGRSSCRGTPIRMPRKFREALFFKEFLRPVRNLSTGRVKGTPFCFILSQKRCGPLGVVSARQVTQ